MNIKPRFSFQVHRDKRRKNKLNRDPQSQEKSNRGWLTRLAVLMAVSSAALSLVAGGWLAVLLILDPDGILWLNRYLPQWLHVPLTLYGTPKTLPEIEQEAQKYGFTLGRPIPVASELLIPVWWSEPKCQGNCNELVALRIYQYNYLANEQEIHYQLLREVEVPPIAKSQVASAGMNIPLNEIDKGRFLPLKNIDLSEGGAKPGVWINLSSDIFHKGKKTSYGHLFFYEPSQQQLNPQLQWISPGGKHPQWQEITGEGEPELLLDQSVGVETRFKVYQLQRQEYQPHPLHPQPAKLFRLVEISPVQPLPGITGMPSSYRTALNLSSQGLWSSALEKLEGVRTQVSDTTWTKGVQGQMDVINLHAEATKSQCYHSWSKPSEQIIHCLVDGNLQDALLLLQSSGNSATMKEVAQAIKANYGRFQQRVAGILEINPDNEAGQIWSAMLIAMKHNTQEARKWWSKQPNFAVESGGKLDNLLEQLEIGLNTKPLPQQKGSKILGTAQLVEKVNPDNWLTPKGKLPSVDQQRNWYRIQVSAFGESSGWTQGPFINWKKSQAVSSQEIWRRLGLSNDSQIQVSAWTFHGQIQSINATIKAARFNNSGLLELLAVGDGEDANKSGNTGKILTSPRPLAHTTASLRWLQPGSVTLGELDQVQPELVAVILPELWQELKDNGLWQSGDTPKLNNVWEKIAHWQVQTIDLTGNGEPEVILSLDGDSLERLNQSGWLRFLSTSRPRYKPGTLIFAESGTILYSEFSQDSFDSFCAIAQLSNDGGAALLVSDADSYYLKRWSPEEKRFE